MGGAQGMANSASINVGDFERLHASGRATARRPDLARPRLARMGGNNPATAIPPEIYRREIEAARNLGLPVSVHASGSRRRPASQHDLQANCCARTCRSSRHCGD